MASQQIGNFFAKIKKKKEASADYPSAAVSAEHRDALSAGASEITIGDMLAGVNPAWDGHRVGRTPHSVTILPRSFYGLSGGLISPSKNATTAGGAVTG